MEAAGNAISPSQIGVAPAQCSSLLVPGWSPERETGPNKVSRGLAQLMGAKQTAGTASGAFNLKEGKQLWEPRGGRGRVWHGTKMYLNNFFILNEFP